MNLFFKKELNLETKIWFDLKLIIETKGNIFK